MPQPSTFVSFAQNREDVVLRRALGSVEHGRYVEVGANDPSLYSMTRGFYDLGWRGITVEPVPGFAQAHRDERPGDVQVQAAVTDADVEELTLHVIPGTGLSTLVDSVSRRHADDGWASEEVTVPTVRLDTLLERAGWDGLDIHFLAVDVEGAEDQVLRSLDLTRWRPWVLVVEATAPRTTERTHGAWEPGVLAAGYELCLFDGLSRFYVSPDHPELRDALSYGACPLDEYDTDEDRRRRATVERLTSAVDGLTGDLVRWRTAALTRWAEQVQESGGLAADRARIAALESELDAHRRTVSWRVTAPLRAVRGLGRA